MQTWCMNQFLLSSLQRRLKNISTSIFQKIGGWKRVEWGRCKGANQLERTACLSFAGVERGRCKGTNQLQRMVSLGFDGRRRWPGTRRRRWGSERNMGMYPPPPIQARENIRQTDIKTEQAELNRHYYGREAVGIYHHEWLITAPPAVSDQTVKNQQSKNRRRRFNFGLVTPGRQTRREDGGPCCGGSGEYQRLSQNRERKGNKEGCFFFRLLSITGVRRKTAYRPNR